MIKLALLLVALVAVGVGCFGGGRDALTPTPTPQAARAQVTPAAGDRTVEISQADLSSQLNQQMAGQSLGTTPMGPATLKQVNVELAGGEMHANGQAEVAGNTVPVTMNATPDAENGHASVNVTDLRAAGVPLPASACDSVQRAIQSQVDAQVAQMNLTVKSVSVEDGKLVIIGSRN